MDLELNIYNFFFFQYNKKIENNIFGNITKKIKI